MAKTIARRWAVPLMELALRDTKVAPHQAGGIATREALHFRFQQASQQATTRAHTTTALVSTQPTRPSGSAEARSQDERQNEGCDI